MNNEWSWAERLVLWTCQTMSDKRIMNMPWIWTSNILATTVQANPSSQTLALKGASQPVGAKFQPPRKIMCQPACHVMPCNIMLCHAMSCYVMWCHVMSCHVMSSHVMSCHVMWCHVMSCHVKSCHVISCYALICHVMSCYVMLCHVLSCYVMLCHVMSCYVMLCHVMSCYVMLCHVMSCNVMLCHAMSWQSQSMPKTFFSIQSCAGQDPSPVSSHAFPWCPSSSQLLQEKVSLSMTLAWANPASTL